MHHHLEKHLIIPNLIWKVPPCLTICWGSSNLNQSRAVFHGFERHNFTKACFLKEEHVLEVQGNLWKWREQHEDTQVLHGGVIQNVTQSKMSFIFHWTMIIDDYGRLWMITGAKPSATISTCFVGNIWVFAWKKSCIFRLGIKRWHKVLKLSKKGIPWGCQKWRAKWAVIKSPWFFAVYRGLYYPCYIGIMLSHYKDP